MNNKKTLGLIVLMVCVMSLYRGGCTLVDLRPSASGFENTPIDPTLDPVQENITSPFKESFIKVVDGVKVLVTPMAHYKISGRVVSKRHYHMDWLSKLSPVDLALAWGEFSSHKYDEHLSYSHSDRYYSYRYEGSFNGDPQMIATHSANEHLIPANPHLFKVLKSIKEDEIVELTGQLVNVEWIDKKEGAQNLNTSLTREDTGSGACEIIYVKKVKVGNKIYE